MKVNIKQISDNTGFSPATVSNALNGKHGVNQKTAEIICEEASRLGYIVQDKISKIKFITYRKNGKIIDGSLFFSELIEGVEKQAKSLGYETVFIRLDRQDKDFDIQLNEVLNDSGSAFILLATEMDESDIELFDKISGRLILLDGWSNTMKYNSVLINSTDSVCAAVEYLVKCGHKDIGYIRGDYRIKAFEYREYGYKRTLAKYNLEYNENYVATVGTQPETAYEDMKTYLAAQKELPTAFFCDNDSIAIGAIKALKENGYKIPDDISIVGFDDLPLSSVVNPELTTVHVYKHNMGKIAVRKVLDEINNKNDAKSKIEVCGELIIRQSVKNIAE